MSNFEFELSNNRHFTITDNHGENVITVGKSTDRPTLIFGPLTRGIELEIGAAAFTATNLDPQLRPTTRLTRRIGRNPQGAEITVGGIKGGQTKITFSRSEITFGKIPEAKIHHARANLSQIKVFKFISFENDSRRYTFKSAESSESFSLEKGSRVSIMGFAQSCVIGLNTRGYPDIEFLGHSIVIYPSIALLRIAPEDRSEPQANLAYVLLGFTGESANSYKIYNQNGNYTLSVAAIAANSYNYYEANGKTWTE